jgi:hypothetical protein
MRFRMDTNCHAGCRLINILRGQNKEPPKGG